MAAMRKETADHRRPHLVRLTKRETVGGMHYMDWVGYERYSVAGMLYGHHQIPTPTIAGMHFDWVGPRRTSVGGMRYGPPEA